MLENVQSDKTIECVFLSFLRIFFDGATGPNGAISRKPLQGKELVESGEAP
jgi:hypothetical protein